MLVIRKPINELNTSYKRQFMKVDFCFKKSCCFFFYGKYLKHKDMKRLKGKYIYF